MKIMKKPIISIIININNEMSMSIVIMSISIISNNENNGVISENNENGVSKVMANVNNVNGQ
jgi:hypothetical protein